MHAPGSSEPEVRRWEAKARELPRSRFRMGYLIEDVDRFVGRAIAALRRLVEENRALRSGLDPAGLWPAGARELPGPLDVQAAQFRARRLGGSYRMRPVDELLDDITDALNGLVAQNEALRANRRPREAP